MAYTNEQLGKALEDLTIAYNNFIKKAKDAAISAMSETVIKQIKQDAKTYIAEELTAQKNELMQAIEHAKIALRNSAIEAGSKLTQAAEDKKNELAALITAAESQITQTFEDIKNKLNMTAVAMEKSMKETTEQAKKNAVEKLNDISEKTILQTDAAIKQQIGKAEKALETSVDMQVKDFKALAKQEGMKIQNLTQSKIQEFALEYKKLYDNMLYYINLDSGRSLIARKLEKIEKVKLPKKDGILTFFIKDSAAYILRAYICDKYMNPVILLGYAMHNHLYSSVKCSDLYDGCNLNLGHLPFYTFNYYAKDLITDENGDSYIRIEGVRPGYQNTEITAYGYMTAEANTDLLFLAQPLMREGFYRNIIKKDGSNYLPSYDVISLPYGKVGKNIIIGILIEKAGDRFSPNDVFNNFFVCGYITNVTYAVIRKPVCNFFKFLKAHGFSGNKTDSILMFFKIPAHEVIANTELEGSVKILRLKPWFFNKWYCEHARIQDVFIDNEDVAVNFLENENILPPSLKTMKMTLKSQLTDDWKYDIININPFLIEEKRYVLEADFNVLKGNPSHATLLFFDYTTQEILAKSDTPVTENKCRVRLEFCFTHTIGHRVNFLCYSGKSGHTEGIQAEYSNFSLIEKAF